MDDEDEVSATPGAGIDLAMDIDDTFEESSVRKGKRKVVD
jgi:phosphatidate phosphatase APP1